MTMNKHNLMAIMVFTVFGLCAIYRPVGALSWSVDRKEVQQALDLMQEVKKTHKLSGVQRGVILDRLHSKDDLIVCLAACGARCNNEKDTVLLSALKSVLQKDDKSLKKTFLTLAILHQELLDQDNGYKIRVYEELALTEQYSLALEATKTLLTLDKNKGIMLLKKLGDDDYFNYSFAAHCVLDNIDKPEDSWVFRSGVDNYDLIVNLSNGALSFRGDGFLVPTIELKRKATEKPSNVLKKDVKQPEKKSKSKP